MGICVKTYPYNSHRVIAETPVYTIPTRQINRVVFILYTLPVLVNITLTQLAPLTQIEIIILVNIGSFTPIGKAVKCRRYMLVVKICGMDISYIILNAIPYIKNPVTFEEFAVNKVVDIRRIQDKPYLQFIVRIPY